MLYTVFQVVARRVLIGDGCLRSYQPDVREGKNKSVRALHHGRLLCLRGNLYWCLEARRYEWMRGPCERIET